MPADFDFIIADARIDLKQWNKAVAQMEADAKRIENFAAVPIEITVKVNDKGLRNIQQQVEGLDADITADVKFTASGDDITTLREEWDDPLQAKVKFTQTGDDIVGLRDKLDNPIQTDVKFTQTGDDILGAIDTFDDDVKVNVKMDADSSVDSTLSDIESDLNDLKALAKIQLVLDAASFVKDLGDLPLVGQLIEIEELSHRVMGQTGRDFENAGRVINDVYVGNWGESKDEIAGVVTQVLQLRDANGDFLVDAADVEDTVVGAYQAAAIGSEDTLETLRAATLMVKNGFAPSFKDAFDILSLGFSQGLNQNGDMLDTFSEYSSTFGQLGLTAQGFFNILSSGTESGVFNTDKIADSFKEMLNLTKEEVSRMSEFGEETDRTQALTEAGLMDEAKAYAAGEITGDEFSQAVIDTLAEKFADPETQQRLGKAIFSPTMVEDAGLPNILQTDFEKTNIWKGQAQKLSDEIFSGPGSAFQTMQRTLETHFLNALINSVEAQEFMDKITNAAQTFGTELAAGANIGEALEVALEIPGLSDTIHEIESAFGNIAIVLLEVAASIGETFGMEVGGLRDDIARFAEGQFVFDIQTAESADELAARMQSAINRGVETSDLVELTGQAVQERLDMGDLEGAQQLVDAIAQIPDMSAVLDQLSAEAQQTVQSLGVKGAQGALQPGLDLGLVTGEAAETRRKDLALLSNVPLFDNTALQQQVNTYISTLNEQLQTAVASGDLEAAKTIGDQLGIQNIDQFIGEQQAQKTIDTLFPKPSQADLNQYVADSFIGLQNALVSGDYAEGATFAQQLMDTDNPTVQAAIDDFATTLIVGFNNALAVGDVETASNIMDILGLSPEANEPALSSMETRLSDFSASAAYDFDQVTESVNKMGDDTESSTDKAATGTDRLYGALTDEKGVLGITRLDSLAKRFDAVTDALKSALSQIDKAEDKVGEGAVEGAAVGGIRGQGVTMVGEAGREMIFSDERFAVLNNQTTERLYTALSGMAGITNNTSTQRTMNYSPTVIVQNDAQAALFGSQSLNQLRGEAF
jgi:hypothetical protein